MALRSIAGGLRGGVAFLTRVPVGSGEADWDRFRSFPAAFPLVAYPIGAVAALPFLSGLSAPTVAFGYLLALVAVVGIPHFDGVADLGDAVAAHGADDAREALKDTATGVGAIVAIAVVVGGLLLGALGLAAAPTHRDQARDWLALPPYLDRSVSHLDHLPSAQPPLCQRLYGDELLRPDVMAMGRVAEGLHEHLQGKGRALDIRSLHECHTPVHFDAALHQ